MTCLGLLWSSNAEREIPLVAHMKMWWLSRIDVWNGGGGGVVRHRRWLGKNTDYRFENGIRKAGKVNIKGLWGGGGLFNYLQGRF